MPLDRPPAPAAEAQAGVVHGTVDGPEEAGPIFVGLFRSAVPQGRPVACAILAAPGPYRMARVPPGRYIALAVTADPNGDLSFESAWRGAAAHGVSVTRDGELPRADITLRPPQPTDPPIVISLPHLVAERRLREETR